MTDMGAIEEPEDTTAADKAAAEEKAAAEKKAAEEKAAEDKAAEDDKESATMITSAIATISAIAMIAY